MRNIKNYFAVITIGLTSLFSCSKDEVIISEPEVERVVVQTDEYHIGKSSYRLAYDGYHYTTEPVRFVSEWDSSYKSEVVVNGNIYPKMGNSEDPYAMVVDLGINNTSGTYVIGLHCIYADTLHIVCTLYNEVIKE